MTSDSRAQVVVRGGTRRRDASGPGRRDPRGAGAAAAPAFPARGAGGAAGRARGLLCGKRASATVRRRRTSVPPHAVFRPQPLQIRESFPAQATPLRALGVLNCGARAPLAALLRDAVALEAGRAVARDLGGADPERMTPGAFAAYLQERFADSPVRVRVVDDRDVIAREYPLFAAVSRAADSVSRHRGKPRRGAGLRCRLYKTPLIEHFRQVASCSWSTRRNTTSAPCISSAR